MGSIRPYETAKGRRYSVRYLKPDRTQGEKRGFKRKRDAELYLASVEVSKARGAYVDPVLARVTVAEWMDRWLAGRADLRPSSRDRAEGIIRRNIAPSLGNVPLGELSRVRAQEWAAALSAEQSPASVRKIVNVLSGALQLAVEDGRIAVNVAARLKLPKVVKAQKRYLTHEQVHELAEAVERRQEGYGTLVLVLAYCGLRWAELAGLTVADVDLSRSRLEVRNTMVEVNGYMEAGKPKDYEERSVPMPAFLVERVAPIVGESRRDKPLFPGVRSGGPLRNRSFRRYFFDPAAAEVGLEGLTPHEMRHTCASLAVSAGASVKVVQKLLGHSSAKETLDTYADLFDDDLDSVAVALDRAVMGKKWANGERPALRAVAGNEKSPA